MKKVLLIFGILVFLIAGNQCIAQNYYFGAKQPQKDLIKKVDQNYVHKHIPSAIRQGGEDIANAVPISQIPYSDAGNTCSYIDDYDEACPFYNSISPDVVYSYTPTYDIYVGIDLCGSTYDTKVFVYEDGASNLIDCNDDFYYDLPCGVFVSKIVNLLLTAGHTYFIIIDGYDGDCGNYTLNITEEEPCVLCLPCALPEGEPDIQDDDEDVVNGGCNNIYYFPPNNIPIFSPITLGQVYCGRTNNYLFDGGMHRDTDWYKIIITEPTDLYWSVFAEAAVEIIIFNDDCDTPALTYNYFNECEKGSIHALLEPGTYRLFIALLNYAGFENGINYMVIATDGPPPSPWCVPTIPVSNWALGIGIFLIIAATLFRVRRYF